MQDFIEVCLSIIFMMSLIFCAVSSFTCINKLFCDGANDELREAFLVVLFCSSLGIIALYPLTHLCKYNKQEQRAIETGEITYSSSGNLLMSDNVRYIIYGVKR